MLRDLEQIDNAQEPGLSRQLGSDVLKADLLDRLHFDLAFVHPVSPADLHVGPRPDSHAAGDFAIANGIPQTLSEHHCTPSGSQMTLRCASTIRRLCSRSLTAIRTKRAPSTVESANSRT